MRIHSSLLLGTCLAACGEDVVPGGLTDVPLLTVEGSLVGIGANEVPPRVGALWIDPLRQFDDWPAPRSYVADTTEPSGAFHLRFFRPPPASIIRRIASAENKDEVAFAFAFAEIVAFDDRDGDDGFQVTSLESGSTIVAPDVYRGTPNTPDSDGHVVIYVERSRTDDRNVIPELDAVLTSPPGYYLVYVGCSSATRGQAAPYLNEQPSVPLPLIPATSVFPERRACLRTHVSSPVQ